MRIYNLKNHHKIAYFLSIMLLLSSCGGVKKRQTKDNDITSRQSAILLNPDLVSFGDLFVVDEIKAKATGILSKAFAAEEQHRISTLEELDFLLRTLKERFVLSNISKSDFKQRVYKRLDRDLAITNDLNRCLEMVSGNDRALYLCKENKLYSVISSAYNIIQNHFDTLIQGKLPIGFKKSFYNITTLETDKGSRIITGSFKTTCLKGVIITMLVELAGSEANASDLALPARSGEQWADYSWIFHTIPVAKSLVKTDVYPKLRSFTYFYKDDNSPSQGELGFPHSGYYSGGGYERGGRDTPSRPEDCSSWVSKILGTKHDITTFGLMQFFRIKSHCGLADKSWVGKPEFQHISNVLEPINAANLKEDIKPGDVLCIRRAKQGRVNRYTNYGDSGHMAVALFATDTHLLVLACTRDAPFMEGIGLQKISLQTEENSDLMFLRYKKDHVAASL
ncbi:MAG: hypothetical protein LBJ03_02185 [Holosporales bacterium]|jgi:hypothetical protein|nr:hypothetical protein [Holosporales bacterium]